MPWRQPLPKSATLAGTTTLCADLSRHNERRTRQTGARRRIRSIGVTLDTRRRIMRRIRSRQQAPDQWRSSASRPLVNEQAICPDQCSLGHMQDDGCTVGGVSNLAAHMSCVDYVGPVTASVAHMSVAAEVARKLGSDSTARDSLSLGHAP